MLCAQKQGRELAPPLSNILYWFFCKFHIIYLNPIRLPVPPYLPLKINLKQNKATPPLTLLSFQHLFILVAWGALVCLVVHPLVLSAPPANVHCNEFKASGTPLCAKTPLGYPAVIPSHGGPVAIIPQDQSLHTFQQVRDGVDVRMSQPKAQDV